MTSGIAFTVTGLPVPKLRPRMAPRRIGKATRTILATPPRTVAYELHVGWAARAAMKGAAPLQGPLTVAMRVRLEPPASISRRRRKAMLDGLVKPTGRPDADNYAKAILDGCNGVIFVDDAQVTDLHVRKLYAAEAGVDVRVDPDDQPYSQVVPLSGHLRDSFRGA